MNNSQTPATYFHEPFSPAAARSAAASTAYPDSTNRTRDDWPTPLAPSAPSTLPVTIIPGIFAKPIDMSWRTNEAACDGAGVELFFPGIGESAAPAIAVCRTCPLIDACREHAMQHERFGVWGGLSEAQRKARRRGLRADVVDTHFGARTPMVHGTRGGYEKHRRYPETYGPACDECRSANRSSVRRDPVKAEQKRRLRRLQAIEGGAA